MSDKDAELEREILEVVKEEMTVEEGLVDEMQAAVNAATLDDHGYYTCSECGATAHWRHKKDCTVGMLEELLCQEENENGH